MAPAYAAELENVTKRFGRVTALSGTSLRVPRGSTFALLGPNGAGKTTALRVLLGLVSADSGRAQLAGRPVASPHTLRSIGAAVDRPAFYPYLSGWRNLQLLAVAAGARAKQSRTLASAAIERTGLSASGDRSVSTYSSGMRQRLALATALLFEAPVVILDEPTDGLDPAGIVAIRAILRSMRSSNGTVILSSHQLTEVERTCDLVAFIDHGVVLREERLNEPSAKGDRYLVRLASIEDRVRAVSLLRAGGWSVDGREEDPLEITVWGAGGNEIARALGQAGIYLTALTPQASTLEDLYMAVVGSAEGSASP